MYGTVTNICIRLNELYTYTIHSRGCVHDWWTFLGLTESTKKSSHLALFFWDEEKNWIYSWMRAPMKIQFNFGRYLPTSAGANLITEREPRLVLIERRYPWFWFFLFFSLKTLIFSSFKRKIMQNWRTGARGYEGTWGGTVPSKNLWACSWEGTVPCAAKFSRRRKRKRKFSDVTSCK